MWIYMNVSKHSYFDFLIAKSSQLIVQGLDPVSEKLLEFIALENFKGNTTTMMQALRYQNNIYLSEKTLAKHIKQLQKMELIEVHIDSSDRRVKCLYPSTKTSNYFSNLSDQIFKVNTDK
jgi:DNA-binding HxlR family transcriptional regulator